MTADSDRKPRICFVIAPQGQTGGGMGRVKDYILQSGGDRFGRVTFEALNTRGPGCAVWTAPRLVGAMLLMCLLVSGAVLRIWAARLAGRVALVHVTMGDRGSIARKGLIIALSHLVGVPAVLHLHAAEIDETYARANPAIRFLIRLPFQLADCCLVLGERRRLWLVNDLGIDPNKVEILYNGVPGATTPADATARAKRSPQTIMFLGNLLERKGLSDLIHALAGLPETAPAWQAVIAGGGNLERYQHLAASLGISDRVHFSGWIDRDTATAMVGEANMLVLPSYHEDLPLVILEALGCGTPVICTAVGTIPEVLEAGKNALFVPAGDRAELTRKILLLLDSPTLQEQLSREGLALYNAKFTHAAFVAKLFDCYRRYCRIAIEDDSVSRSY